MKITHSPNTYQNYDIKLQHAAQGFESLFLQKLFNSMQDSIPKSSLLHSKEEELWQNMLNEEYAKNLASAGGIGLSQLIMQQLNNK